MLLNNINTTKTQIMKTGIILLFGLTMAGLLGPCSVTAQTIGDFLGEWNTEAPDAPSEYTNGVLKISEDVIIAKFSGDYNEYPSTLVKCTSDTLVFEITGLGALCTLRIEDKTRMTGKAVWPDGESPFTMTKAEKTE